MGTTGIACSCLADARYSLLEQFEAYITRSILQQAVALDNKEHVQIHQWRLLSHLHVLRFRHINQEKTQKKLKEKVKPHELE